MPVMLRIVLRVWLLCVSLVPATEARISVVGDLTHEKTARPGETYRGIIFVQNPTEDPQEVKVYPTDYRFFYDGTNDYGEPGKLPRSNALWITFSPKQGVIPPRDRAEVSYTVKVPDDPTLVGTYWSMLMVEGIEPGSPESELGEAKPHQVQVGIRTVVRYGIQMVTQMGDSGARRLQFLDTKLLKEEERRILQVDIENTGERLLRPLLWTELYDEKGNYTGRFEGGQLRTYPGTSVRFKVDLSDMPGGTYKALVVADCGGEDLFGATYDLQIEP